MRSDDFNPDMISASAFFTGHRRLPEDDRSWIADRLHQSLISAYEAGYRRFFCGCALGFDTLAAFETVRFRDSHPEVILSLAIPCAGQSRYWNEKDSKVYEQIIRLADEVTVLSPVYYRGAMQARNRYMADRSSLCICFLTRMRGGTASTVRYALTYDRIRIVNLAIRSSEESDIMRENTWNCMFISPSVQKNAVTAPLCLMPRKKMTMRNT